MNATENHRSSGFLPVWFSWLLPLLAWPVLIGINFLASSGIGEDPAGSQTRQLGRAIGQAIFAGGIFLGMHVIALVIAFKAAKSARLQALTGFFSVMFSLGGMAVLLVAAIAMAAE